MQDTYIKKYSDQLFILCSQLLELFFIVFRIASRGKKLTSVIKETEKVLPPSTTPLQTTKVISENQKNNAVGKNEFKN